MLRIGGDEIACAAPRGVPARGLAGAALFLHGAGGSGRQWGPVVTRLDAAIRPILPDLPGCGASGGVLPTTIDGAVALVESLLDALELPGAVDIVGHSLGGFIALAFAVARPDRCRRLAILASTARLRLHADFLERALTGRWDLDALRPGFAPGAPEEGIREVFEDLRRLRIEEEGARRLAEVPPDLSGDIGRVTAPTLVVAAGADVIISPRHARTLAAGIPGARLVTLDGAGHYVHIERVSEISRELNRHLGAT